MVAGASAKSFAAPPEAYCSLKTLSGSYTYSIQGYWGGKAYASSGMFSFDGAGRITIIYTSSIERTQLFTTGTYTVNGNCSGSMTLAAGTTVNNFYLDPTGDSFNFVRVSQEMISEIAWVCTAGSDFISLVLWTLSQWCYQIARRVER